MHQLKHQWSKRFFGTMGFTHLPCLHFFWGLWGPTSWGNKTLHAVNAWNLSNWPQKNSRKSQQKSHTSHRNFTNWYQKWHHIILKESPFPRAIVLGIQPLVDSGVSNIYWCFGNRGKSHLSVVLLTPAWLQMLKVLPIPAFFFCVGILMARVFRGEGRNKNPRVTLKVEI